MTSRRFFATITATAAVIALATTTAIGHDLFMRPDAFFVAPGSPVPVKMFSGTFSESENAIKRDRILDLSMVTPGGRTALDPSLWTERDPQTTLAVPTQDGGTYLLAAALKPRPLSLDGAKFNAYLKEEGLDHVLAARKAQGRLQEPSQERYQKFVKALVQVGDNPTESYATSLGYAAELMPLANPYTLKVGDTLPVRLVVDGKPAAGHVLFAGGRTGKGARIPMKRLTADADGVVRVTLTAPGAWYVKVVHMREVTEPDTNYESRWSTLTWGVK